MQVKFGHSTANRWQWGRTIGMNTTELRTKKYVQKNVFLKDRVKTWNINEILIYVCINTRE